VRLAPNWTLGVVALESAASLYHFSSHHIIIIIDDNSNNVPKQLVVDQRKRTTVLVLVMVINRKVTDLNVSATFQTCAGGLELMTNGGPLSSRCTQQQRNT
jgi:hypothetical protein